MSLWLLVCLAAGQTPGADSAASGLDMTEPIACKRITGYKQFEPLEEAVVSRNEKLLIYVEPVGHGFEKLEAGYRLHLVQDLNVRRKGQKKVLWGRKQIVEYEATSDEPPLRVYLGTTLGVKNFAPGEYEAELVLHDLVRTGPPARRTLAFRIIEQPPAPPRNQPPAGASASIR